MVDPFCFCGGDLRSPPRAKGGTPSGTKKKLCQGTEKSRQLHDDDFHLVTEPPFSGTWEFVFAPMTGYAADNAWVHPLSDAESFSSKLHILRGEDSWKSQQKGVLQKNVFDCGNAPAGAIREGNEGGDLPYWRNDV